MAAGLLHQIFDVGEKMRSALESDQIDEYLELLAQRGTLLDSLQGYKHPSQIEPEWQPICEAIAGQHELLTAALADCESRLQDELLKLGKTKGARRSYNPPQESRKILNEDLRG